MRIISGSLGGRRIQIPKNNWPTRPTTDRVRESFFNILSHNSQIEGAKVLDLFAGTGLNSWEFISRGAQSVTLVERHRAICNFLNTTASHLNIDDQVTVLCQDAYKVSKMLDDKFDFIFADPPYHDSRIENLFDIILDEELLSDSGTFILEHSSNKQYAHPAWFSDSRSYGDSTLSFFKLKL